MELRLYDTLTKEKRPFVPLDPKNVRMYVCGPTVYDFAHIGNARPVIVFDVLFRLLRFLAKQGVWDNGRRKTQVTYVRNITDVDDKINARALERNISIRELTEQTYDAFTKDVSALKCLPPTVEPRATEHIEEMKDLIERLVSSGHAYVADDHVLFKVSSMTEYGQLGQRSLREMEAGARVDVAPYKQDPLDFVLWKPSKPGEPSWSSPCLIPAPGRPGWHIECSAMAWKHLGEEFDIHGGGLDLIFPHHENEIAQSCCAFHTQRMARFWVHNGFLQVGGEKMSKSEGNFYTLRDLRTTTKFGGRKWSGAVQKFAMLQTHYHQPIDWTVTLLEQAEARLSRWMAFASERTTRKINSVFFLKFLDVLLDDLNTPKAFAVVDEFIDEERGSDEDRYTVYKILNLIGIPAKKSRAANAADNIQKLIREIGNISKNDWSNLERAALSRPVFPSGVLKPETKLFASIKAAVDLWSKLLPAEQIDVLLSNNSVKDYQQYLLKQGAPAESAREANIRRMIARRDEAKARRDFEESDRIRNELALMGVVLKDTKGPDGKPMTTWEFSR
ncbi:cysteinyl-tRNA synthetase [Bradyrhizobium niftali]|uniref:cysteine--tRNA ligase n=1 Tax=Bradyrhizobium niftali TaxID=2560055 RepID=UPI0038364CF2